MCYTVFYVFVFRRFTQNCERRLLASLRLSARPCVRLFVCLRETAQLLLKWFPWNLIFIFFENAPKKLQLIYIWQTVTATLYEDLWTFVIISGSGVLRMRNISEQICRGNKKTLFNTQQFFFRKSCCWWGFVEKHAGVGQATDDDISWRMRFACRISKATATRSEFAVLTGFLQLRMLL